MNNNKNKLNSKISQQNYSYQTDTKIRDFTGWIKGNPLTYIYIYIYEADNVFIQLDWEEHFGSSLKVYEKKHPFPGLLINYDDSSYVADNDSDDDDVRDPNQLSQMFEYGFIRFIKLTSHNQASQLP